MSRVFIAWSGNKALANTLASYIRQNQPGIHCTVGGTDSVINESINATVKDQMMKCDRAIILLRKNDAGTLSGNVLFELGYLMAKKSNRVHLFLLDMDTKDSAIPSDLHGVWASGTIKTIHADTGKKKSNSEIAREIGSIFFNSLYKTVHGNKMELIEQWYRTKDHINNHLTDPTCADFGLAQYVLCYLFSAKFFMDIKNDVKAELENLERKLKKSCSPELSIAIDCALNTFELLDSIQVADNNSDIYMTESDYNEIYSIYEDLLIAIDELKIPEKFNASGTLTNESQTKAMDDMGDFSAVQQECYGDWVEMKLFLRVVINNFIEFAQLMMLYNSDITPKYKLNICDEMLRISQQTVNDCKEMILSDYDECVNNNEHFCTLIAAYMYRGMACAVLTKKQLLESDTITGVKKTDELFELHKIYLKKSLAEREKLYKTYHRPKAGGIIFDSIELEYFLAIAEYYPFETDKKKQEYYLKKLKYYVAKTENRHNQMKSQNDVFFQKIYSYVPKDRIDEATASFAASDIY